MKHLKIFEEWLGFSKITKTPREIINIFSDVFTDLDDMGAWISYVGISGFHQSHHRLFDIESDGPISEKGLFFEIKTHVDSFDVKISNTHENQICIYSYLRYNINNLINRFEKLSKCKVKKVGGQINYKVTKDVQGRHLNGQRLVIKNVKTNFLKNRFKIGDIESLIEEKEYEITNIILFIDV